MTVKHDVWSLLGDREALTSVSDAVIVRATDKDALAKGKAAMRKRATAMLEGVETPEQFAEALAAYTGQTGNVEALFRVGQTARAAATMAAAGLAVFVASAYEQGWVGRKGKRYTATSLAEACGVSVSRISQLTPAKYRTGTGGRPRTATVEEASTGTTTVETVDDAPATSTDTRPIVALQQALTRLESASKRAFTPEDHADLIRTANALDVISRNLRLIAKPSAAVA
jgi:transcriptional regulator with XRE-family HTH domain